MDFWERKYSDPARKRVTSPVRYSPTERVERERVASLSVDPRMIASGKERTRLKAHVCPRKVLAWHPDPAWRVLGDEQSREAHETHGACNSRMKACSFEPERYMTAKEPGFTVTMP